MPACLSAGIASGVATRTGAAATDCVPTPACAVEQTEQTWCDVVDFSGCACAACTTPIANSRAIERTQMTLTKIPRLEVARIMVWADAVPITFQRF